MVSNASIQIRLTANEKQRILNKMQSEGYKNLSVWIRNRLLSDALWTEQKISAIYNKICLEKKGFGGIGAKDG